MKKILATLCLTLLFACTEKNAVLEGSYKMTNAPDNAEITIAFADARYSGKAAVNNYFGSFEKDGNKIKFGPAGSTMMAGPENLMKIERQYLQNLAKINAYSLNGKTLTLTGTDNLTLTFEKQ